jgi:hypothetical protein
VGVHEKLGKCNCGPQHSYFTWNSNQRLQNFQKMAYCTKHIGVWQPATGRLECVKASLIKSLHVSKYTALHLACARAKETFHEDLGNRLLLPSTLVWERLYHKWRNYLASIWEEFYATDAMMYLILVAKGMLWYDVYYNVMSEYIKKWQAIQEGIFREPHIPDTVIYF